MKPILEFRNRAISFESKALISIPSIITDPLSALSSVPRMCKSVDLPDPDLPMIETI